MSFDQICSKHLVPRKLFYWFCILHLIDHILFTDDIVELSESKSSGLNDQLSDDIISEQDVRYWMLVTADVNDMETAVTDNPRDVAMWIKLAYKQLHSGKQ